MNKQGNNTGNSSDRPVMGVPPLNGKEIMRETPIDQMSRERLEAELQSAWNTIKLQQHWVNTSFDQKNGLKTALYKWIIEQMKAPSDDSVYLYQGQISLVRSFLLSELERFIDDYGKNAGNVSDKLPEQSVVRDTIGTRQPEMLYKAGE